MLITVALCDDDEEQVKYIRRLVFRWAADKPFGVAAAEYESGEQFLFEYPDNPCDLLLLDIEMRGINGMELAKSLRSRGDMLPIIFITGYSDYISEGYDVEALHYLLKPVEKERLFAVLDRYAGKLESSDEILLSAEEGTTHIPIHGIVYIEAFGRKTAVHMSDKRIIPCNMSISEFEDMQGFLRPHRSYIVNLRYVRSISRQSLILDDESVIPLSRRQYNAVNKEFIDFYTKE